MQLLSLVVPCFNEEESIPLFYEEVKKLIPNLPVAVDFHFIDDGSKDNTLKILRNLSEKDSSVHYVSFSRNFGKESAIYAGLESAKNSDFVATMDADLQDPPSLLPQMLEIILNPENECDCVATRRQTRKGEPVIRSFFANMFYRLINKMSSTKIENGARDYRLMTKKFVEAVLQDKEYNRFSKGIFSWVGFNVVWLSYDNIERKAGKTKWSFFKLLKYSIEGILAYSSLPLYISSIIGLFFCLLAVFALLFIVIRAIVFGDPVAGWPSLVCIIIFIGGILLLNLGIIGLYISKIYMESKKRQLYIIRESK